MDPAALAALLRDYGPWGLLALSLLANRMLLGWWRDCMQARIEERGTAATALERQATANAATAAALDEVREGQMEVAKLITGSIRGGEGSDELLKELLRDIKNRIEALANRGVG